jgi:uncharacterized membrane protein YgdD (TMEM256/DUF423 family)
MFKNLLITCFLGLLALILGAFGTHALKESLTLAQLSSFETAVRYQMYHVMVLLFVNIYNGFSSTQKNCISCLFFIGILLFSGSIYAIQLNILSAKSIWFITPLGGLFLMMGWLFMIVVFVKKTIKK